MRGGILEDVLGCSGHYIDPNLLGGKTPKTFSSIASAYANGVTI